MQFLKPLIPLTVLFIAGCNVLDQVPSFYDDNESKAVVDLWVSVHKLDCASEEAPNQVKSIVDSKDWLKTYSIGKGSRDVVEMITILEKSLDGLTNREFGETYCNLKKTTLLNQSEKMTKAMMRRF